MIKIITVTSILTAKLVRATETPFDSDKKMLDAIENSLNIVESELSKKTYTTKGEFS